MIKHSTSVDQSDRKVPYNLRQSGPTPVQMLISTRVRKSPYWHLSMEAGCWRATVYNRIYHPRGYVKPEDGGAMVEYEAIKNHVTMWNVAVERQIQVKGPDAEAFVDYVITRDATKISPMRGRYVILCNQYGGVLNDPILLRISKDEFWFSLSDSDIGLYLQGVNHDNRFNVHIDEIDVSPVQIQGPKAHALMNDLIGDQVKVDEMPFYRIVVADSRRARDGKFIDQIGTYNPMLPKDSADRVKMDLDKAKEWIAKGAKPSDRISIFLSNLGVMEKPVITEKTKKHLPKKKAQERLAAAKEKEEAAKAAAEEPKAEEVETKPAEDAQPAEEPKAEEAEAKKE